MPEEPATRFSGQPEADAFGLALAQLALSLANLDTSDGKARTREFLQQCLARIEGFMEESGISERDRLCVQRLFENAEGEIDAGTRPEGQARPISPP